MIGNFFTQQTLLYSETELSLGGVLGLTGNVSGRWQRVEVLTASLKRWGQNLTANNDYALAA